jgi:hypothetical protein
MAAKRKPRTPRKSKRVPLKELAARAAMGLFPLPPEVGLFEAILIKHLSAHETAIKNYIAILIGEAERHIREELVSAKLISTRRPRHGR